MINSGTGASFLDMSTEPKVSWWARLMCAIGIHARFEHQRLYQDPVFRTMKIKDTLVSCSNPGCDWEYLKDKEFSTLPERREGESFLDWMTR